jgi:hypothetical protein
MAWPQQDKTPPPFLIKATMFPHLSQRKKSTFGILNSSL